LNSIRSKPALVASIPLLLAFFLATHAGLYARPDSGALGKAIFQFLHPGIKQHPFQWLGVEGTVLLAGTTGLVLFGIALFGRFRCAPAILRQRWRSVMPVLLLGYLAPTIISFARAIGGQTSLLTEFSLIQIIHLLGYVSPVAGFYCAARLQFGARRWRADNVLGYVAAAAALFGLAWRLVGASGLGEFLPIAGALGSRGLGSLIGVGVSVAVSGAIAWAGLALVRKDFAAPAATMRNRPALLYFLLGGFVLSVVIQKTSHFSFLITSLAVAHAALYGGMLAAFAIIVLLCLGHGAGELAGVGEAPEREEPRTGILRRVRAGLSTARFWTDLGLSLVITFILIGIAYGSVGQIPILAAAFLMPLIIFGFLIGPIVMFVIGVLRGRPGFAAAPVIIVLAIFAYRYASLELGSIHAKASVEEAASFNVYPFAEPSRKHDLVVIEGAYDSRPDGNCQAMCQQILFNSTYAVAYAEQESGQWRIYRLAAGADFCRQPAQVKSYLEMIGSRRLDTCLAVTREAPHQDALVIRDDYALDLPIEKQLPKGVGASVTEFHERIGGQDRLLGRVVSGVVQPPLLSDKEPTKTTLQMSGAAFYAAALKLPLSDQHTLGNADPAAVVATLESLFSDPTVGDGARDRFRLFGGKTEAEVAPKRAAILRFWQSNDPQLIKLGLASLYHIRNLGLDFAKPAVAQFLGSDDSMTMKAAVSALYAFDQDLEFAKVPLADLILSDRITAYDDDHLDSVTKFLKSVPGGFAPDARARAKTQLDSNPDLAGRRLLAVLAIVARGSEQTRREAVEWILRNQGEDFERVMGAIGRNYKELGAPQTISFWSEEDMKQLVARGASISDRGLIDYVRALQHQTNGRELRPQLRELLEQRADKLEKGATGDNLAKSMRRAAKDVR
jgi:hypothetical protein